MEGYHAIYIYFGLILFITLFTLALSGVFPSNKETSVKFSPYESGIQTETHLFKRRFPLRHYLVALIFLIFDIEVIFTYPWAVVAKSIGPFAFYEMTFFMVVLFVGFIYVWKKGGLQWE